MKQKARQLMSTMLLLCDETFFFSEVDINGVQMERLSWKLYSVAGAIVSFTCLDEDADIRNKSSGFKKRFHADATGIRHRVGSFLRDWFYRLR